MKLILQPSNIETQFHGEPLAKPIRYWFEDCFQADLGSIRLHTDRQAAITTRKLGAAAFAYGEDIFLDWVGMRLGILVDCGF